jgi:hypothetical protein
LERRLASRFCLRTSSPERPPTIHRGSGDQGVANILPFRSKATCQKQDYDNNEHNAEDTDAAVTEAVSVTAKAATKATEQENDEDDNKDGA